MKIQKEVKVGLVMLAFVGFALCLSRLTNYMLGRGHAYEPISEYHVKFDKYLGEKYILDKDTFTIVNYNTLSDGFVLSNGLEIRASLVWEKSKNK